jgi:hypothetical protein
MVSVADPYIYIYALFVTSVKREGGEYVLII